jgi:hypothetical protein
MLRRHLIVLTLMPCALSVALLSAGQAPSRAAADRANEKMTAIVTRALLPPRNAAPLRTTITDAELNAYFVHHGPEQLPPGVKNLSITMGEAGAVQTRSLVDLDAVRTSQTRGWLDPLSYVTGSLEVVTVGRFSGSGGKGVYRHESATVGGISIPRTVLQELLVFYTKTPEMPKGLMLDQPFDLPAAIREVQISRGSATVVQ